MEELDLATDTKFAARAVTEAEHLVQASETDIRGLDEVNAIGADVLSAWHTAAASASRVVHRYLDRPGR